MSKKSHLWCSTGSKSICQVLFLLGSLPLFFTFPHLHSSFVSTVKIEKGTIKVYRLKPVYSNYIKIMVILGLATLYQTTAWSADTKKGEIEQIVETPFSNRLVLGLTHSGCLVFGTSKFCHNQEWSLLETPSYLRLHTSIRVSPFYITASLSGILMERNSGVPYEQLTPANVPEPWTKQCHNINWNPVLMMNHHKTVQNIIPDRNQSQRKNSMSQLTTCSYTFGFHCLHSSQMPTRETPATIYLCNRPSGY